jgi:preprotein translocase subunit YajC
MSPILVVYILVFVGLFYFLAIRPQRNQRRRHTEMVSMLKKGDEIITIGGLFGTVRKIGDDWVELEIANRTRVRFLKRAISSIVTEEEEEEEEEDEVVEGEASDEADEPEEIESGDAEEGEDETAEDEAGEADEGEEEAEGAAKQ